MSIERFLKVRFPWKSVTIFLKSKAFIIQFCSIMNGVDEKVKCVLFRRKVGFLFFWFGLIGKFQTAILLGTLFCLLHKPCLLSMILIMCCPFFLSGEYIPNSHLDLLTSTFLLH